MDQTPAQRGFEHKVRLSRCALLFEAMWPRLWFGIGLAVLFIVVSLAGLWPALPPVAHRVVLGLFGLGFLVCLISVARVRWPSRDAAIRRLELRSGVTHRPASAYEDTLTLGADNDATAALWRAHRARLSAMLAKLRVGHPQPRADRFDPFALRGLLLLSAVVLLIVVGDSASDRLRAAFRLGPAAGVPDVRLDAWVTPPAYTGRPPLMLADGARGAVNTEAVGPDGAIEVPERSLLIVRHGGEGALALDMTPVAGEARHLAASAPAKPGDVQEIRLDLRESGRIKISDGGSQVALWSFRVIPDLPPRISLTKDPEKSPRGALKLAFKVEDDYGVVSAEARISRAETKEDRSATAWARREDVKKGPRLPLERPPVLALRLPHAYPKSAEGKSFNELGDNPWAGLRARLTLQARDLADQVGKSEPIEIVLPERQFQKPLARAVIEQRKLLVEDSRNRKHVMNALDALTMEPEGFIDDLQVYLGLRSVYWRLQRNLSRATMKSAVAQLWNVALRIEDGDLSDAERALRQAQDRLSKALEEGASDAEIQKLMQELRQAMAQFLEQLSRQAQNQPPMQMPPGMGQNQFMTQRDLEQMLRNLENMARSGNRDTAQQMLSQLRDLLDRLQSGRMADRGQSQRFGQMMDEFGNLIGRQQQLMDDTYAQNRQNGNGRQGQQGQRGQQGQQGQRGQGQGQQPGSGNQLGDRQGQLREMLDRLQQGMQQFGMQSPGQFGGAAEAMERAERALRDGNLGDAADEQARALDQLRQGARNMAEQMLRQMPSQYGMSGTTNELDPMGRPPQSTDGRDPGVGVKVPDQIDIQRAREILEELRKRLGEPTRPALELDYIERLLKRF